MGLKRLAPVLESLAELRQNPLVSANGLSLVHLAHPTAPSDGLPTPIPEVARRQQSSLRSLSGSAGKLTVPIAQELPRRP